MARCPILTGALGAIALVASVQYLPARAAEPDAVLKVPRFESLRADKVNLRTGPGRRYPIEWVLTKKDMPVEITAEFDHWRRVREWDGTEGWVQEHMVWKKRFVVVVKGADRPLFARPDTASELVARVEPGVVARLDACQGDWCRITAKDFSGWMPRSALWGVYPDDKIP